MSFTATRHYSSFTPWANGAIPAATYSIVSMEGHPFPCTLSLTSTAVGRKIEISTDGTNYTEPTLDTTETAFCVLVLTAPVLKVKFTGAAADTWRIM